MTHPFDAYLESNAFADDDYLFVTAYKRAELTTGVFGREYLLSVADWRKREAQPLPAPVTLHAVYAGLRVRSAATTAASVVRVLDQGAAVDVTRNDTAEADDHRWRKLADGSGWVAERNLKDGRDLLRPT